MQAMNLIRKFEMQKMKESETIKEYANKLLSIANQVRLLGFEFSNSRIVQKILLTAPKKFEASIASLENTKDPSKITLAELVSAMQSQELRRLMRQDSAIEGALPAKHHHVDKVEENKVEATPLKQQLGERRHGKMEAQVSNDEIEKTVKLLEERKNKVRALAGAFQTVIDHQTTSK